MLFWLCGGVLLIALLAGGGTHSGFYGDAAVQALSIPLLSAALWPAFDPSGAAQKRARLLLAVCAAFALVVGVQVFPLPFDPWSGRSAVFPGGDGSRFAGNASGWSTFSMAPHATWAAAISVLVPLSIFGAAMQLSLMQRMRLCWAVLAVGAASLALGFLQVAQGEASVFRFYEMTNPAEAVGFFANRNHFAAFLNVTLVLSALWLAQTLERSLEKGASKTQSILWLAAAGAFFVAIVAGIFMARSRTGALLALAALAGIVAMIFEQSRLYRTQGHPRHRMHLGRVSLAVALLAALFALQFASSGLAGRLEGDVADDLRLPLNVTTFRTALRALPLGTGLGSFVPVYATVERGEDAIDAFANRAHDDLAEFLLETGLMGAGLGLLFLAWFGRRVFAVWFRPQPDNHPLQALLERASCLAVALLLFHSLTDYPLRTTALSAAFGFFCGMLAAPDGPHRETPAPRGRAHRRNAETVPFQPSDEAPNWPEDWQRKPG